MQAGQKVQISGTRPSNGSKPQFHSDLLNVVSVRRCGGVVPAAYRSGGNQQQITVTAQS